MKYVIVASLVLLGALYLSEIAQAEWLTVGPSESELAVGSSESFRLVGFGAPPVGGSETGDAMYEIWGDQGGSGKPAWFKAMPSILKLLYVGFILSMAVMMLRTKPKEEQYPIEDMK